MYQMASELSLSQTPPGQRWETCVRARAHYTSNHACLCSYLCLEKMTAGAH